MKKKLKICMIVFAFMLLGCEKDLYQAPSTEVYGRQATKKQFVTIEDVPEIIPALQNYSSVYNYLSSNQSPLNRSAEELDLDLEHIVKITNAVGKESYSIVIKNESGDYGKTFFENLHIMEKDGVLDAFILKYHAVNDYIPSDFKTFTGNIEIYDKERNFQGVVQFENGARFCQKIPVGCWTIIIMSDGNLGVRSDCAGGGGGEDNSNPGWSPTGGDGGSYSGSGTTYGGSGSASNPPGTVPNPNDPTLINHTTVGPNPPLTTFQMANKLYDWLEVPDLSLKTWLRNNLVLVDDISYLIFDDMGNVLPSIDDTDKQFFLQGITAIKQGGQANFVERIIVDPTFQNNQCLSSVYTNLGHCQSFNTYIHNFDGNFSVANLKLESSTTLLANENAITSPPSNYLITITFNSNNLARPGLSIARTFIHELIHAEVFRKLLSCANMPNINFNNYTDAQWRDFVTNLRDDFPGLYDYYLRYTTNTPNGQPVASAQHQLMAQHYRDLIVEVLKEYDNTLPDATYQAIAWEGLKGTVAWNNLTAAERAAINATISSFNSSNTNCQ